MFTDFTSSGPRCKLHVLEHATHGGSTFNGRFGLLSGE